MNQKSATEQDKQINTKPNKANFYYPMLKQFDEDCFLTPESPTCKNDEDIISCISLNKLENSEYKKPNPFKLNIQYFDDDKNIASTPQFKERETLIEVEMEIKESTRISATRSNYYEYDYSPKHQNIEPKISIKAVNGSFESYTSLVLSHSNIVKINGSPIRSRSFSAK